MQKNIIVVALSFIIIFTFSRQVNFAQNDEVSVENTCPALMRISLDFDLEDFDFIAACETGIDCFSEKYLACQLQVAVKLLERCETGDNFCENLALLNTASFFVYDDFYGLNPAWQAPESLLLNFPKAYSFFAEQDFESALAMLEDSSLDSYSHPLVAYSRGLIYEMLNLRDEALNEYDKGLELVPHHLLIHYARAVLLGELGRQHEVSFEVMWLEDYLSAFAPDLLPLIATLRFDYPLDSSRLTSWMKYPLRSSDISPFIDVSTDLSSLAPTPVQLGIYPELKLLITIDLSSLRYPNFSGDSFNTYILEEIETGNFSYIFPELFDTPDSLILERRDGLYFGEEYLYLGETSRQIEFILAPIDAADPRIP